MLLWSLMLFCSPSDVVLVCLMLFWSMWCCYDPSDVVLIALFCSPLLLFWSLCFSANPFSVVSELIALHTVCADDSVIGVPPRASHPPAVCRGFSSYAVNFYTITYYPFFLVSGPRSLLSLPSRPRQGKPQDFSSYQYLGRFCQYTKKAKCLILDLIFLLFYSIYSSVLCWTNVYWQNLLIF